MTTAQRIDSIDNLRTLMVLSILLLHAACAYAPSVPWWHAQDSKNQLFDLLLFSIDTFALPTLFFISGSFARESYERHGPVGFITGKLKRFGLPLILLSAFYIPAMVYIGYLKRVPNPEPFLAYWRHWIATITDPSFALIDSMQSAARYQDAFSPHHLWFISMLLVFFLGYAACRAVTKTERTHGINSRTLIGGGFLIAIAFAGINLLMHDWTWARLGPFLLFQPTRLPVYAGAFILGIYAENRLMKKQSMPGPLKLWIPLFLLSLAALLVAAGIFMTMPKPTVATALIHGALRALLIVSGICLLTNVALRFMHTASRWQKSLSSSSYDIYLLHMPLTVFLQAALIQMQIPLILKMIFAFVLPAALCWGLSRTLAGRAPATNMGTLIIFFAAFSFVY